MTEYIRCVEGMQEEVPTQPKATQENLLEEATIKPPEGLTEEELGQAMRQG